MKKALSFVIASILAASLTGCGSGSPAATTAAPAATTAAAAETTAAAAPAETQAAEKPAPTGKTIEIKMVTTNGSSDPSVAVFQECAEEIKEKTNGEIDIQVYPDGQILTGDEGIEALKSGASVIVVNDCNTLGDYVPVFNTLCAPYMFTSSDEIQAFVKTDTFQDVVKVGDDAGFHLICANYNFGARSIIADGVEVRSIDDVAPLKLGIPSVAAYVNIFKEFGVNYTTGSWGDRVSGIETKQLNGCEGTAQRVSSSKVYDLMEKPVYSDIRYFVVPCAMQVSYDFWKTIPEQYQTIITDVLTAGGVKASGIARDAEADYMKAMTEDGVLIIENKDIDLSGFQAAADRVNADLPMYAEIKAAVQEANK